ncbi:MAG: efflux RND transporter permease subunit [Gammaproteobacteria bacterium]|nr:efflux RND transporter permease subunit [Gammaproteobacteria bacterium]
MNTGWIYRHSRSFLFALSVFTLGGVFVAFRLPVALFPNIDFPRIVISIDAGDRPVQRMVVEVTQPLEQVLRAVPGVAGIRTKSSRGAAEISLNFNWGDDIVRALLQVDAAINGALPDLPPGTRATTRRMDPTVFPSLGMSVTSDALTAIAVRDFALYRLRPLLSAIPGVAKVEVLGGRESEYQILVDPAQLRALDLTIADVVQALSSTNVLTAVGRVEDRYRLYLTLADAHLRGRSDIEHTVVRNGANGVVELEDIAEVISGEVPAWTRVTADGHDAVLVNVMQQRGANTVRLAADIKRAIAAFAAQVPAGVRITPYYDQSDLIRAAAGSVRDAIIASAFLSALVLLVGLRNFRMTLVVAIIVPSVLAMAVLVLFATGQSFNIMTLGGMAAAVGLVVDDTVVMIEHIARRIAERDTTTSPRERVLMAAMEMTRPLLGSSFATIVVFVPLAFLSGVAGGFFKALALTMVACLTVSFVVALIAVPLLARVLLRDRDAASLALQDSRPGLTKRLYRSLLTRLLGAPLVVPLALALLGALGYYAFTQVSSGFMPRMDEGGFVLDYRSAPGTSLTETDRLLRAIERRIAATPEVASYSRRTGLQLGGGLTEANEGDFFVRLHPLPRRNIDAVLAEIRQKIESEIPGLRVEIFQLMEDVIGDLTAVPQPIEVKLFGDSSQELRRIALTVAQRLKGVPGVVEVFNGITIAGDAIDIRIDRIRAALEGLDPESVRRQVGEQLEGSIASRIEAGPKMVGVRIWTSPRVRDRIALLERLQLRAPDGHYLPLTRVAEVRVTQGAAQEARENLKPMVAVTARIEGRDLGSTMREVQTELKSLALPSGVYLQYGGLYQEQQKSFRDMLVVCLSAFLLVALLLLVIYESFPVACSILVTAGISLAGVMIGLWLTGTELNISSLMGLTMVVGIVTELAIFYFAALPTEEHPEASLLVDAGVRRLRPIMMTSSVAILSLAPLALGIGEGAAMQQPLAIAIISGLVFAVPLVLMFMPGLYLALQRFVPKRP